MPDKHYVFVDRKCPRCNGEGEIGGFDFPIECSNCMGTGMVGSYEEVPHIEYDGPSAFAHRLRLTREIRKVSMSELAAQLGISVVELSDIERGRIEPIGELRKQIMDWVYNAKNS